MGGGLLNLFDRFNGNAYYAISETNKIVMFYDTNKNNCLQYDVVHNFLSGKRKYNNLKIVEKCFFKHGNMSFTKEGAEKLLKEINSEVFINVNFLQSIQIELKKGNKMLENMIEEQLMLAYNIKQQYFKYYEQHFGENHYLKMYELLFTYDQEQKIKKENKILYECTKEEQILIKAIRKNKNPKQVSRHNKQLHYRN